jgi:hypothetical protein
MGPFAQVGTSHVYGRPVAQAETSRSGQYARPVTPAHTGRLFSTVLGGYTGRAVTYGETGYAHYPDKTSRPDETLLNERSTR